MYYPPIKIIGLFFKLFRFDIPVIKFSNEKISNSKHFGINLFKLVIKKIV